MEKVCEIGPENLRKNVWVEELFSLFPDLEKG